MTATATVVGVVEPLAILIAVGAVGQVATWREVRAGRITVWLGMGFTMGVLGVLSLIAVDEHLSPKVDWWLGALVGLASGLLLFGATRVFVAIASSWELFRRHVADIYGNRSGVSLRFALLVAVGLSVPGEELFWRGLTQRELSARLDAVAVAALLPPALYAATNAASRNLAIVASATISAEPQA